MELVPSLNQDNLPTYWELQKGSSNLSNCIVLVVFSFFAKWALFFSSFLIVHWFCEACFTLGLYALVSQFNKDAIVDLKVDLVNLEIGLDNSRDKQEPVLVLEVKLIVIVNITIDLDIKLVINFVELKVKL